MNKVYEQRYFSYAGKSWWHFGRRNFIETYFKHNTVDNNSAVLDIGCSTGFLLQALNRKSYNNTYGIDISKDAIIYSKNHGVKNVFVKNAEKTGFESNKFDFLVASDILEHIENDKAALLEWKRILKKGGIAFVFVPAFKFLWSYPDILNHHKRRYNKKQLLSLAKSVGFSVVQFSYWNFFLFIPHIIVTFMKKALSIRKDNLSKPIGPVNILLKWLISFENWFIISKLSFPFGISCLAVLRKK